MTAILAAIGAVLAIVGGLLGNWLGKRNKAAAVTEAQKVTEIDTRTAVAQETAVVASQAQADATTSRSQTDQEAHALADQGEDALDAALKAQGALRDQD